MQKKNSQLYMSAVIINKQQTTQHNVVAKSSKLSPEVTVYIRRGHYKQGNRT